ncbi:MAG: O-antigen ligase family protein [Candidatus Gottesmanbacteria bacterium]|nr:O-antigen ligase family protein [Candidatus Gottesmanbacteria bacterium]
MKLLTILFLGSLLLGQIGGMSLFPGVVVYAHDILLAVLVIISALKILHAKRMPRAKLITPIAVFIVTGVVSLVMNYWRFPLPSLLAGSLYLVRWTLYAFLYIFVLQGNSDIKFWLKGLYIVGIGFGILGLIQFFLYPDLRNLMYLGWDPHYYRLFSTLLDPNFMGIILVFTLLLGFGLLTKKHRLWFIAGQLVAFTALLLTYSRSSFLALGAAIVVWACMRKQWKLFIALFVFAALIFILPKTSGSTLNLTRPDSSFARVGNWQESLQLIIKAPVFGYGFDTLRYVRPAEAVSKAAAGLDSSILFILATTGLAGLAAYTYLVISLFGAGNRAHKTFYIATLSALLVHSVFVNSMFYPWVMIWIWILTGAMEKTANFPDRRHKPIPYRNNHL